MEISVYLLEHNYETDDGMDHAKTLGIFSSKEKAMLMIDKYRKLPGFKKYPDGFLIDRYVLDQAWWLSGFGID